MNKSTRRRIARVLACGAVVGGTLPAVSYAQQKIIITGNKPPCCGVTVTFDDFMTNYFRGGTTTSFDAPESEAYVLNWGFSIKPAPSAPKAAMTMSVCALPNTTADTRAVTKDSEPLLRKAAANQMFFANLPNFANVQRDGLIVGIVFTDGSQELYRHTTAAGLQPVDNTFIPGNGVAMSVCSA